jgi:hypothetical protein
MYSAAICGTVYWASSGTGCKLGTRRNHIYSGGYEPGGFFGDFGILLLISAVLTGTMFGLGSLYEVWAALAVFALIYLLNLSLRKDLKERKRE